TPERGSVGVTLKQTGSDGGKASYELRVKDTGIGMSEEFAEHVFEAFERERSSTVDEIQGTGLGMAITKSFVDLMGGTIDVNTKRGEGTEFVIKLTFDKGKEVAAEKKEVAADFSGARLLLTDDNPINLEIAKMILTKAGFTVETAENGQEALDAVKASAPGYYDAVLMDINMPVMNGLDASRAIRALEDAELAKIPIIAMTASALSEDVRAALDAGMNAHVSKPIEINKLMATISDILAEKRGEN
ncbi:MAG: response regulator, partial [Clostridia bacterium]|nr:response regulator [Clostridia bacterium]